ncbi:MAG: hypothetical protein H7A23_06215 [Leptospiraceae bacterium]|nr:hypothetical protein [Leptospiraceae bacterium]MCP5494133.1 hypothetical protein [Leptospiraceae bacterium]
MADKVIKIGMIYIYILCGIIFVQWFLGLFIKDFVMDDNGKRFIYVWSEEDQFEYFGRR